MEIDVLKASGDVPVPFVEGAHLHAPRRITAQVRDGDVDVQVEIAFVRGEERYVVQAVRGANLTSEVLHALRPPEIIREAVLGVLFGSRAMRERASENVVTVTTDRVEAADAAAAFLWARLRGRPSPLEGVDEASKIRMVALLYQLAYMVGQRPTATVAQGFDLPRSTAGRLIRQARDQGLLGPTTERKAGV